MERTPAAVIKIATQAKRIGDCLRVFEILERATASRPVIGLAMGTAGIATRVLSLARGGLLTFGALRRGAESASGQPTAAELASLFRVKELSRKSMVLGIIGNPVGHSRSPRIHNAALRVSDLDGVYLPFEVQNVDDFVRDFVRPKTKALDWRLRGLSVTIPHKLAIIPHLDFIDPTAKVIGAVNTVVVEGDELHGYNTDCAGAIKPLAALADLKGARVAVLGAGGSARAVAYGLQQQGAETTIYARDPQKAATLAAEFQARSAALDAFDRRNEIVVNCTPIGMHGHSEGQSPLPPQALEGIKLVYDLIYVPEETALLAAARSAGCRTLGGLAMLATQAVEQFRLWTGVEIPVDDMLYWASDSKSQI
jgi:3-dehydroquinate dehydratase/shikimate dehydrogenase